MIAHVVDGPDGRCHHTVPLRDHTMCATPKPQTPNQPLKKEDSRQNSYSNAIRRSMEHGKLVDCMAEAVVFITVKYGPRHRMQHIHTLCAIPNTSHTSTCRHTGCVLVWSTERPSDQKYTPHVYSCTMDNAAADVKGAPQHHNTERMR